MPPKSWDDHELRLAGAMGTGPTVPPDLTNNVHNILRRERWQVEDREYEALLPSIRLASHWIEVAMPYIATFLPSDPVHKQLEDGDFEMQGITLKKHVTRKDIQAAREGLDEIANTTKWQVNYEMHAQLGWLGITRLAPMPRPWHVLSPMEIYESDKEVRKRGDTRRPLIIGIMGEYVNILNYANPTGEQYLRAAFMAACTITHEVGHLIYHQDFRSWNTEGEEPYVEGDHWAELGCSLMAWIFSGYNPQPCEKPGKDGLKFDSPLHWEPHLSGQDEERPVYKPLYSIPIQYMQNVFTESFWTGLGETTKAAYSATARGKLKPNIDSAPKPATAMLPQFHMGCDDPEWVVRYNDRGPQGELTELLTSAEIELAAAMEKRLQYDEYHLSELPKPPKGWGFPDDEDEEEEYDMEEMLEKSRNRRELDKLFPSEIHDGWLEADFAPTHEQNKLFHEVTRIEVRYLPDTPASPLPVALALPSKKRRMSTFFEEDDDDGYRCGPSKKVKLGSSSQKDEDEGVDALIQKWSIQSVEARFTHLQAYNYCSKRDIPYGVFEGTPVWQQTQLNYKDDKWLIQSMRQHALLEAQSKYKVDIEEDVRSLLRLKMELRKSVREWGPKALHDHCQVKGLNKAGDVDHLRLRVIRWFTDDIESTKRKHEEALKAKGVNTLHHNFDWPTEDHGPSDDLALWNESDFTAYFRTHSLPTFGTLKCMRERVIRFRDQQRNGVPTSRNISSIYKRTDKNGWETYVFSANLHSSSVDALKSALFITGRFSPESVLTLYFAADRANPLKDEEQLSNHKYRDWSDLTLQVAEKVTEKRPHNSVGVSRANPIDLAKAADVFIYKPRGQTYAAKGKGQPLIDPAISRAADIRAGRTKPTLAERMMNIQDTVLELTKAMMPSGGRDVLRPHTQTMRSRSAVEILDNLEDMEEVKNSAGGVLVGGDGQVYEEERGRRFGQEMGRGTVVDLAGEDDEEEEGEDDDDDDDGIEQVVPPEGVSHMGDLFRSIRR